MDDKNNSRGRSRNVNVIERADGYGSMDNAISV